MWEILNRIGRALKGLILVCLHVHARTMASEYISIRIILVRFPGQIRQEKLNEKDFNKLRMEGEKFRLVPWFYHPAKVAFPLLLLAPAICILRIPPAWTSRRQKQTQTGHWIV